MKWKFRTILMICNNGNLILAYWVLILLFSAQNSKLQSDTTDFWLWWGEMWAVFDVHVWGAMFQLFSLYRVGFLINVDSLTFAWNPLSQNKWWQSSFSPFFKDSKQKSVIFWSFFFKCEFWKSEVGFTCFYHVNILVGQAYFKNWLPSNKR